jgi:DNA-binding NtrC family response regulator
MTEETAAFLNALAELENALERNQATIEAAHERIEYLRRELTAGRKLPDIVPAETTPVLVRLLTESANLLHTYGTRVRRTEARALHREGMTMEEIATLFGVSRQRVSQLLRDVAIEPAP